MIQKMLRTGKTRGQAMVEFSIISILLFGVMFGLLEGGRLLLTYHEVNHAAREGARYAAAQGVQAGDVQSAAEVSAYLEDVVSTLNWDRLDVGATWPANDANLTTCQEVPNGPGCPVVVEIRYQFEPIVAMIFGPGTIELTGTSTMRIHY